jgi:hypothetical protein
MCTEINLVLPLTSKETYLKLNKYISFDSSVTGNTCLISGDHFSDSWLIQNISVTDCSKTT